MAFIYFIYFLDRFVLDVDWRECVQVLGAGLEGHDTESH